MTKLEIYEDLIRNEGVKERTMDSLPSGVNGACVMANGVFAIFLIKSEISTNAKRLEVLSHERCHLSQEALYKIDSYDKEMNLRGRLSTWIRDELAFCQVEEHSLILQRVQKLSKMGIIYQTIVLKESHNHSGRCFVF